MKNILIINSSEETMRLLKKWLARKAYEVKITTHLEDVVGIINEFNPKLVIIDIDQQQVIPAIKNNNSSLLLLLMTGHTEHGTNSGLPVDDIIEKPFSLELLEQKVNHLMTSVVEA